MQNLDGSVALITGGARGQGEAIARMFVEEGALVVLGDVLDNQGSEVAASLGKAAVYTHLDVSRPEQWKTAVSIGPGEVQQADHSGEQRGHHAAGLH